MKILLVAPSNNNSFKNDILNFLGMNLHPKYGLLLLGSYAKEMGHEVRYLDESFEDIPFDENYDLIGISCNTNKAKRAYEIADKFRDKDIQVVLGGIHPSIVPDEAKEHADSVIIGEADYTWPILLQDIQNNEIKPFYTASNHLIDLKCLPKIHYDLIPEYVKYRHPGAIEISRGCPYDCEYCSTHFWGTKYRVRPIEKVIEDIASLKDDYIIFMDDNPMADKEYAMDLFGKMKGLGKVWTAHSTLDVAKYPKLLKTFKESGCRNLIIGFDTLSIDNLKLISKKVNLDIDYREAVKIIHDHGIDIMASIILGFDFDTERTFDNVYNFVTKNNIFLPTYWVLTPYPGTRLFKRLKLENRIFSYDWNLYDSRHLVFKTVNIDPSIFMKCFTSMEKDTFSIKGIIDRSRMSNDNNNNIIRKIKFNLALKSSRALGATIYGG